MTVTRRQLLEAELAALTAGDKFREVKAAVQGGKGKRGDAKWTKASEAAREARQTLRELRAEARGPGDAIVTPDAIGGDATANDATATTG